MSLSLDAGLVEPSSHGLKPLWTTVRRYGVSASGPVATSGAHFLASLLFVRNLPAAAFGLFSFVLVIVPFAMSMTGALLVIPVTRALTQSPQERARIVASCLKMNLLLSVLTAACVFGLLLMAGAQPLSAFLLGLFGGALTFRWFARCFAFVEGRLSRAIASDMVYAAALVLGLGALALSHHVGLVFGALTLLLAAIVSYVPLGRKFFVDQAAALFTGSLRLYGATFRDLTCWSLLGVIFTEMTVNAHAYLVTFVAGPSAFALLALGMLLMRPASLVQSALPDLERPAMTRQIAARDWRGLSRTNREFGTGLFAMLVATLILDAGLLFWVPGLILKKGYSLHDVVIVAGFSAAIMAVRCLRSPLAVLLQAVGAFKEMAAIGMKSSVISIAATLALLLTLGPMLSLGGVLLGELVILYYCRKLVTKWEAAIVTQFESHESGSAVVAITGAQPGESKSAVAVSIARAAAQMGRKTVLVDCDPNQLAMKAMEAPAKSGLYEVLTGTVPLSQALAKDSRTGAYALAMTRRPPKLATMFTSAAMAKLIQVLKEGADLVVLDCSRAGPEAGMLAKLCDATLLVTRKDALGKMALSKSVALLAGAQAAPLAIIATK